MKKLLYVCIVALSMLAPVKRLDIAKLLPVESVAVIRQGDMVILKTDTGDVGSGSEATNALADLRKNATQVIYLDTARYLLVGDGADSDATELRQYLKRNVDQKVYAGGDVREETRYLDAHENTAKPA